MSDRPSGAKITLALPEEVALLKPFWQALYVEQKRMGMQLRVPANGFDLWSQTMLPGLGRFTCAFVARRDNDIVGFLAGRLRPVPAFFGGGQVGFISEVFVDEKGRGSGVGANLVEAACTWFRQNRASRVELQVLTENVAARGLYRKLGWRDELVEMTWTATE